MLKTPTFWWWNVVVTCVYYQHSIQQTVHGMLRNSTFPNPTPHADCCMLQTCANRRRPSVACNIALQLLRAIGSAPTRTSACPHRWGLSLLAHSEGFGSFSSDVDKCEWVAKNCMSRKACLCRSLMNIGRCACATQILCSLSYVSVESNTCRVHINKCVKDASMWAKGRFVGANVCKCEM